MEPAAETGRRLALLVATSAYSDPDLRQLRAPGHDADQLAEVLGDPRIGAYDVQVLLNPASGEVQEGIEDFCTDRHPGDQLLIYLSCHGVLDSYGRLYYAAANTRRQRLAATAVAAAWLNERLEDCRARRQILVLDCCHSGAFAKGAKGDSGLALHDRFEPHGRGRVVLTASRSTEYSFEGGQVSGEGVPSVFTHAIVNGLRTGEADLDRDGLITVTDLYQYVFESVRAAEPRQTPELWTYGAKGNLVVAYSVRSAVIEPEPLPEDMRVTLESPRRRVRETAVAELADLLDSAQPGLALTARQVLERIAEEDHPQVAALARIAVAAPARTAADQVRRELTERAHQEAQARREDARTAGEQAQREADSHRAVALPPATRPKQETGNQIKPEAAAITSAVEAEVERETEIQVPQPHGPKIFLCYRRDDTQGFARSIYLSLANKYGREQVFRDIDSTPAGVRFSSWIEARVSQCSVMLVLIGDAWSSAKTQTGQRRLDSPKDFVRHEIEVALRRDIPIIPVRVQGALLPSEEELPPSIADLTGFQSAEVTDSRWDFDLGLLIQAIDNLIAPD